MVLYFPTQSELVLACVWLTAGYEGPPGADGSDRKIRTSGESPPFSVFDVVYHERQSFIVLRNITFLELMVLFSLFAFVHISSIPLT